MRESSDTASHQVHVRPNHDDVHRSGTAGTLGVDAVLGVARRPEDDGRRVDPRRARLSAEIAREQDRLESEWSERVRVEGQDWTPEVRRARRMEVENARAALTRQWDELSDEEADDDGIGGDDRKRARVEREDEGDAVAEGAPADAEGAPASAQIGAPSFSSIRSGTAAAEGAPADAEGAPASAEEVGDGADGDFWDLEDGQEEARAVRMHPPCVRPTAEEVRAHRVSGHGTYRSWCSACVRGSANDRRHGPRAEFPAGAAPEVHSDYGFFRNRRGDHSSVPVLVSVERPHKCVCRHMLFRARASVPVGSSNNASVTSASGESGARRSFAATTRRPSLTCSRRSLR